MVCHIHHVESLWVSLVWDCAVIRVVRKVASALMLVVSCGVGVLECSRDLMVMPTERLLANIGSSDG